MSKEEQLKRQKDISQKIVDVIDSNMLVAQKAKMLQLLNLKLDSLNRAAYYLALESQPVVKGNDPRQPD